ncbi:MAG TPA: GNAT family N-acetyltransferase [Casimicrobiaceae bacterium]
MNATSSSDEILRLADGSLAVVRPVRADDGPRLQAFVGRLSSRSRYLRFFAAVAALSATQLERFLHVDPRRGMALVALSGPQENARIIAEARCVADQEARGAEFAIAVADEFQRKGLGTQLVRKLLVFAAAKGVRRLFGEVLVDNHAMLALVRRLGFRIRINISDPRTLVATILPSGR